MGTVYLAERIDGQFEHHVALKLIKRGMDSDFVLQRFLQERQILARLQHPGIARLLDGNVTEEGRPYFVMEHIDGEPITHYCQTHQLDLPARLRLFLQGCEAVAYAHRNLVVHRDLKPSNILVKANERVKLLDFGIAKLLDDDPAIEPDRPSLTRTGQLIMTPEYAAPEQVRGGTITTATDIYALGVLLYELLAGVRPYQFERLTPTEIERIVCEQDPPKPSTAIRRSPASTTANDAPLYDADTLSKQLRGDLDTIVMMALRKEPERRYPSVEQLAEDLRRYLDGLPVTAREATVGYRARKFFQRHRLGVVAGALVALALVTGLTLALWQARVAADERDRARLEAAKAEEVKTYLIDLFEVSNPNESQGETISARELLDRGAEQLESKLAGQPEIQADMMDVIAEVYRKLGLFDEGRPLAEQALALRRDLFGPEHRDVAASLLRLGDLAREQNQLDDAERLHREALAMRRKLLGSMHVDVANTLNNLGHTLSDKDDFDEAEQAYREAIAIYEETPEVDPLKYATSVHNLALLLHDRGDYQAALPLAQQALRIQREAFGNRHTGVANTLHAVALITKNLGDTDTAETYYREALELKEQLLGPEHPETVLTLNNLALLLRQQGDLEEAEPLYRKSLTVYRSVYGNQHRRVGLVANNLGQLLLARGDVDDAEAHLNEALEIFRAGLDPGHNYMGAALTNMGRVHQHRQDWAKALATFEEAQAILDNTLKADHPGRTGPLTGRGRALIALGQTHAAEPLLREALEIRTQHFAEDHIALAESRGVLGLCLLAQGAREAAAPFLRTAAPILEAERGVDHPFVQEINAALDQVAGF